MPDPELKPTPPPGRRGADWILLDKVAYIADRRNGTTAEGFTHAGQAVQVTLWLADPPGSSHLLVHCPGLNKADFSVVPATIVCSDKDVAILQIHFPSCPSINPVDREQCRYFVYTADHDHPSLDLLPVPIPLCYGNDELGLLPTSSIVLRQHSFPLGTGDYNLHVFSSKTWAWSTRLARLALKPNNGALPLCHTTHEVIVLDGSTLGFVDLWDGILCCRVDDDDDESPVLPLRLIRLPPPMQINTSMFDRASGIRDVVCVDGVIKFVEIANRKRLVLSEPGHDLVSHKSVLHDWELDELASSVADDTKDPYVYACDGWVAVTWNRQTGSDQWLRDCQVDADDVTVSSPKHFDLLPQLFSSHSAGKLKLNKNVPMFAPTFVPQDRGVAYLMCCLEIMDKTACVVLAIDTREKTLQALSFSTQRDSDLFRAYRPYALSKHMSMAPRNSRVGCSVRKRDYAKTVLTDTTILVHGLDARLTEDQILNILEKVYITPHLWGGLHDPPAYEMLLFRTSAEEAMRRLNGRKLVGQELTISWGRDTREKQPLQANANQCNGDADNYSLPYGHNQMQLKTMKLA